jgi:hypothetical protein
MSSSSDAACAESAVSSYVDARNPEYVQAIKNAIYARQEVKRKQREDQVRTALTRVLDFLRPDSDSWNQSIDDKELCCSVPMSSQNVPVLIQADLVKALEALGFRAQRECTLLGYTCIGVRIPLQ